MTSRLCKALGGLVVLNLFFIVPLLIALTANVPRIICVDVRSETPIAVKVGMRTGTGSPSWERVNTCPGSKSTQSVCINLTCDFPTDGFCVSTDDAVLENVFLRKNFILGRWYDCKKEGGVWICTGRTPFLPSLPLIGWCVVALLEILLLVASFVGVVIQESKKDSSRGILLSAVIAALASGFVIVVVPLQSFLANRALFKFATCDFALQVLFAWIVSFLVLGVGLALSRRFFGYFLHSLVLAFVVYEYLQTGILAIGEPPINGEVAYYMAKRLIVRDCVVLAFVFGIFILAYRWLVPYLKWIALGLAVMVGASLMDIKKDRHVEAVSSPLSSGFCSKFEVAQKLVHSGQRNVMMLILDSVSTEVSLDVLAECPDFKESFSGFIAFTNNIGVHDFTESSVPAIMTGKLFDRGIEQGNAFQEYGFSALGKDSFLCDYRAAGISASFLPGSFMFGYSSAKEVERASECDVPQTAESVFDFRPDTTPPLTIFETSRFRLTPFAMKYRTLLMTFVGTKTHSGVKGEAALYPMLANAPVDATLPNNLEIFHTQGGHGPFNVDRNGNQLSVVRNDYGGHLDKTICAFRNLDRLLAAYKDRGIYDKSFVVVTTDHGWMPKTPATNPRALHWRAPTLLWVKPIGAHGPLTFSNAPTWHLNLKTLMLSAMTNNITVAEIKNSLYSKDRVFRKLSNDNYLEWHVDADGNSRME